MVSITPEELIAKGVPEDRLHRVAHAIAGLAPCAFCRNGYYKPTTTEGRFECVLCGSMALAGRVP